MGCVDEDQLLSYLRGSLPRAELATVENHLDGCPSCQEELALLGRSSLVGVVQGALAAGATVALAPTIAPASAPTLPSEAPPGEHALPRGTTVGRYVLLGLVGRGGMGVVYSAYDPELDRKVALKLVRAAAKESQERSEGRTRLLREAQAMARLQHPNAIAVHDVGTFEDQVFIAMEFVDGTTLTTWLGSSRRPLAEVLEVFMQAGRGLAAAHAAGLVHRDFKPDNVLVARDGRARVLDFGLARALGSVESTTGPRPTPTPANVPTDLKQTLTRTGVLLGTPAYMAPEQARAEGADARADQFSFCVALYEGLYRQHPFGGGTAIEIERARAEGAVREPPRESRVPPWLHKAVLRGLRADPAARWGSMHDLLSALAADPGQRQRRWLYAGAAAAVVVAGVLAFRVSVHRAGLVCRGANHRLAGIWDGPRKQAVRAAFQASGKPFAEDAYRGVERVLDAYAGAWVGMREDACEATRVRGEQSEELLDLRIQCLDDRLEDLRAIGDVLRTSEPGVVAVAVQAAQSMPLLEVCANPVALRSPMRLPADPRARGKVEALRQRLAKPRALGDTGKYAAGLALAGPIAEEARTIGYAPLLAQALELRGHLEIDLGEFAMAEKTYVEALAAAMAGRADRDAVLDYIGLAYAASELRKPEAALTWSRLGEAALERVSGDPYLKAKLVSTRSLIYYNLGRFVEARQADEEVLAIEEKLHGPSSGILCNDLVNLGEALQYLGDHEKALGVYRRAHDIAQKTLGVDHPQVAGTTQQVGSALLDLDRPAEARPWLERALELTLRIYGPKHRDVAVARVNLGRLYRVVGELDAAMTQEEAALAGLEGRFGSDYPPLIYPLSEIGEVWLARHQPLRALPPLERAVALPDMPRFEKNMAKFPLARALWESRRDAARALKLASEAKTGFAAQGPAFAKDRREVEAWLAAHPVTAMRGRRARPRP